MDDESVALSKLLAHVLRHRPAEADVEVDDHGWAEVAAILRAADARGIEADDARLRTLVLRSDADRFSFSADGDRIRANEGHSFEVELDRWPAEPPETLLHGSAERFVPSIRTQGLLRQNRRYVHLTAHPAVAEAAGARKGVPAVFRIRAGEMYRTGFHFQVTEAGTWLVEHVPWEFIEPPAIDDDDA